MSFARKRGNLLCAREERKSGSRLRYGECKKAVAAQDPAVLVLVSAQSHLLVAGYTRNQGGAVVSAPKSGSRFVILNLLRLTFFSTVQRRAPLLLLLTFSKSAGVIARLIAQQLGTKAC